MLALVIHVYRFAEVYTVVLAWVVTPLAFFACYLFYQSHYRMFLPACPPSEGTVGAGAEREFGSSPLGDLSLADSAPLMASADEETTHEKEKVNDAAA